MKTKYIKNLTQFNLRVNKEEYEMIKTLREKHAINLSGAFKIFLKELLERLEKWKPQKQKYVTSAIKKKKLMNFIKGKIGILMCLFAKNVAMDNLENIIY